MTRPAWAWACVWAALAGGLLEPVPAQSVGIYTCVDAKGRRLTADRPIPECQDREQRELNPSGTTKRLVQPSLTAQERAAEEERQRQAAEEQARQAEEKRRDRALLARYPSRASHDAERAEALKQVDEVVVLAQRRIDDLKTQRKAIDAEFEFYRRDPAAAPQALRMRRQDNLAAEQAQLRFIQDQEQEKKRVNQRFDQELQRLTQLWGGAR